MRAMIAGVVFASTMLLAGCGGDGAQECALCGMSLTNEACQRFAEAHGCSSGVATAVELCGAGTIGCRFECPDDRPVMCEAPSGDAGM